MVDRKAIMQFEGESVKQGYFVSMMGVYYTQSILLNRLGEPVELHWKSCVHVLI